MQEIAVLRSLSYDRNLVQFYGACLETKHAMLVLEFMEGGDLYQAIQESSYPVDTGLLSWYQKGSRIALDIAKGLVFLHQREVRFCTSLSLHNFCHSPFITFLDTFCTLCCKSAIEFETEGRCCQRPGFLYEHSIRYILPAVL